MQEVKEKMLVETKDNLTSKVLFGKKFTKKVNSPFVTVEPVKVPMCQEWVIQIIMPGKKEEE